jgi:hypothetical protein
MWENKELLDSSGTSRQGGEDGQTGAMEDRTARVLKVDKEAARMAAAGEEPLKSAGALNALL